MLVYLILFLSSVVVVVCLFVCRACVCVCVCVCVCGWGGGGAVGVFLFMFVVLMHCIDICCYLDNRKVCDKTLNKKKEETYTQYCEKRLIPLKKAMNKTSFYNPT